MAPRKPECAIVVEGTRLFLRVGKSRYLLTGGLTDRELRVESERLAVKLRLTVEWPAR